MINLLYIPIAIIPIRKPKFTLKKAPTRYRFPIIMAPIRITLLLLFLLCYVNSFAQKSINIEAIIVDIASEEPLPFTNVIIENTSIGTISNENGVFELTVSGKYAKSNVIFSFVGYQNKSVPLSKFKDPKQKVYMELADNSLDEIVLEGKNKYREFVIEGIGKIAMNYAETPTYLDAYYRELTQIDGTYTKFTDAATTLYYTPYTQNYDPLVAKSTYMRFDQRDTQKRSTPFPDPMDHIGAAGDQAKILAVRKSDNLQQYKTLENAKKIAVIDQNDLKWLENSEIGGGPLRLSGADKIKRKADFFHLKNQEHYRFKLMKKSSYDDRPVYIISFKPKDSTKCLAKYQGHLTMDEESKAIIGYTYQPAIWCKKSLRQQFGTHLKTPDSVQRLKKVAFIKRTTILLDFKTKVSYSFFNGKWYLKNIKTTNYYRNKGDLFDTYNAMTVSELLVHNVRTTDIQPFPIPEVFDTTFSNALFNDPKSYDPEFWQNYSTIVPTGVVGEALKDLESGSSLEEQFLHTKK